MHLRHLGALAAVVAMLGAVACSGDDDDAATSTASVVSAPTTDSRTVATSPSTVATTAISSPTTAAPTATEAPTTTTLPIEGQVRAAMLGYYDFYWRCLRAPADCDPGEVAVPDSSTFQALTKGRDDLIAGSLYVGPEDEGYMVITAIEPKDDHTLVTTCWYSTAWLYFQPPIAGQPATVQNNTPSSGVETFEFVQLNDHTWKVRRSDVVGPDSTENQCPPEQ